MKKTALTLLSLVALSAHAAPDLSTYYCKHQKDPRMESRARYDFRIVETQNLDRNGHDARRLVTIEQLRVTGTNTSLYNSFEAIAAYDDVEYVIDAATTQDFQFLMFLDEEEPAVVISHDSSGAEITNKYNCRIEAR